MIVDAATTVAESDSGNDLLTVKNIYQGANAPADGTITPLQETFRDIKMKRLRLLQSDAFCDLDATNMFGSVPFEKDANGNYGPVVAGECYPLRWHIDWATDNGLTLHVALASTLPVSFAQQGPAETWNPATKARYGIYAKELVKYVIERSFDAGAATIVFEVSNELDIAESTPVNFDNPDRSQWRPMDLGPFGRFLWWINPATYDIAQFPPQAIDPDAWPPTFSSYPYNADFAPRRTRHFANAEDLWRCHRGDQGRTGLPVQISRQEHSIRRSGVRGS